MFTGIIEEVGEIASAAPMGDGRTFRIRASRVLEGLQLGDSIAVDGVCLTVTDLASDAFEVQSVATTLARTTLGEFRIGRRVNLERAVSVGERLGGHLVQGHVDGVGEVLSTENRGELTLVDFSLPDPVAEVTILHGSIAVNGISFTVNSLPRPGVAGISIIPFTSSHTAVGDLARGHRINLEGDVIGKYVRRLLGSPGDASSSNKDLIRAWGY